MAGQPAHRCPQKRSHRGPPFSPKDAAAAQQLWRPAGTEAGAGPATPRPQIWGPGACGPRRSPGARGRQEARLRPEDGKRPARGRALKTRGRPGKAGSEEGKRRGPGRQAQAGKRRRGKILTAPARFSRLRAAPRGGWPPMTLPRRGARPFLVGRHAAAPRERQNQAWKMLRSRLGPPPGLCALRWPGARGPPDRRTRRFGLAFAAFGLFAGHRIAARHRRLPGADARATHPAQRGQGQATESRGRPASDRERSSARPAIDGCRSRCSAALTADRAWGTLAQRHVLRRLLRYG